MPLNHTVTEIALKNGAKGLIIDVPGTTVVSYQIQFRAGGDYQPDKTKEQTAHIMEHMAFGTNKKFGTVEGFSQEFSKNGAWPNASTWDRNMVYYANCAHMEWDRILDLQELAIAEPIFKQDVLDAEKGNVREELMGYANDNGRVLWQQMARAMGDPSLLDSEALETIDNVTLADIKKHHQATHTTNNMHFIVAGDLEKHHATIIKKLESWPLPAGEALPARQDTIHSAPPLAIHRADMSNIRFIITLGLNRRFNESELDAMGALNHILTGTFHSRIWGKARRTGLCYGMGSSTNTDINNVTRWEFYGQVAEHNATPLFELIASQLKKVLAGDISEEELQEARQFALGGYQMRAQTVGSLAGWYNDYFDDETIEYIEDSPKMIRAVKLETLAALAKEFIEQGEWMVGGIGNMSKAKIHELNDIIAKVLRHE